LRRSSPSGLTPRERISSICHDTAGQDVGRAMRGGEQRCRGLGCEKMRAHEDAGEVYRIVVTNR
jgi:hypothetical protein